MIEAKEIDFDAPEKPNVITSPMPKHGRRVNAIDTDFFVTSVDEVSTSLMTVKKNLLLAGLFPVVLKVATCVHFYLLVVVC